MAPVPGVLSAKELEALRDRRAGFSVKAIFRRWKTAQTVATVLVQIPKADKDKFTATMKANGWKVIK